MPMVKITLLNGKTKTQKESLMESIFKAFAENDIPREWVSIIISDEPEENWGVGGETLSKKIAKAKNGEKK